MCRNFFIIFISAFLLLPVAAQNKTEKTSGQDKAKKVETSSERSDYGLIQGLLDDELYDMAAKQIKEFLKKYPESSHTRDLQSKLGEILFKKEKYKKTIKVLSDFIDSYDGGKDYRQNLFLLAVAHKKQDNTETAKSYFQKLINIEGITDKLRHRGALEHASILKEEGKFGECISVLEEIPEKSRSKKTLLILGYAYFRDNKLKKAKDIYIRVKNQFTDLSSQKRRTVNYRLGLIAYNLKNYDEAVKILSELFNREKSKQVGTAYAWALYQKDDYDKAYDVFRLLKPDYGPTEVEKRLIESRKYLAEELTDKSFKELKQIVSEKSDFLKARVMLVDLYLEKNKPGKAIEHLKYVANQSEGEGNLKHWFRLGKLYYTKKKDYESAARVFEKVSNMNKSGKYADDALLMCAKSFLSLGRKSDALDKLVELSESYRESPLIPQTCTLAAEILVVMEDYPTAAEYYNRVIKNYPESSYREKALFNKATLEMRRDNTDKALSLFKRYIEEDFEDSKTESALRYIGNLHFRQNEYEKSVDAYKKLNSLNAEKGLFKIGLSFLRLDKYKQAQTYFAKMKEGAKKSYWQGRTQEAMGEFEEAVDYYVTNFNQNPENRYAKTGLLRASSFLMENSNPDRAIEILKKLKDQSDLYGKLAQEKIEKIYLSRGNIKEAVEMIPLFYLNNPRGLVDAEKLLNKGKTFLEEGKKEEAKELFIKLTSSFPNSPSAGEANFHLGDMFYTQDRYEKSIEFFTRAIEGTIKETMRAESSFKLGNAYFRTQKFKKALKHYDSVLKSKALSEKTYLVHYLKGVCLQKDEKFEKAADSYMAFLNSLPEEKKMIKERLRIAIFLQDKEYFKDSIKVCDSLLEGSADDGIKAEAHFYKAENYYNLEDMDNALVEYLKVTYLSVDNPRWAVTARFKAGEIYEDRGEWKKAIRLYQKVAESQKGTKQGDYAEERIEKLKDNKDMEINEERLEE